MLEETCSQVLVRLPLIATIRSSLRSPAAFAGDGAEESVHSEYEIRSSVIVAFGTQSETDATLLVADRVPKPQMRMAVHTIPMSKFMLGPPSMIIMRLYTGSL